jgi:hypothetical protein
MVWFWFASLPASVFISVATVCQREILYLVTRTSFCVSHSFRLHPDWSNNLHKFINDNTLCAFIQLSLPGSNSLLIFANSKYKLLSHNSQCIQAFDSVQMESCSLFLVSLCAILNFMDTADTNMMSIVRGLAPLIWLQNCTCLSDIGTVDLHVGHLRGNSFHLLARAQGHFNCLSTDTTVFDSKCCP